MGCVCVVRQQTDIPSSQAKNTKANQVHMICRLCPFYFLKVFPMTLIPTKPLDTSTAVTVQQHHTQAAEHFEQAAKSHKEVAKFIGANDHSAAQAPMKSAHEHATKAQEHVAEAAKKSAPVSK
jgi:hypothetical protein